MDKHTRPFFGKEIYPPEEKRKINKILSKYRERPVSAALKKEIHAELTRLKEAGVIHIPFKIIYRKHPKDPSRNTIEILLETQT